MADNLIVSPGWETDPLLVEIRRRFTYAMDEWRDVREEGKEDIKVVAGDPWNPKDKRQRIDAGRPALSLDEIGQYVNQLVNGVRQNQRAIQVTPVGDGANDQTAEFRQDLIRQIEYRSKAQDAYTTGFENAVQRSYGYWRVTSRYCSDTLTPDADGKLSSSLLDQELLIEPIMNPDLVLIDPDFQRPDGSDMRWAFIYERWPVEEYKKRFPKAVVRDANPDLCRSYPPWFKKESIQLAEYWTIETDRKRIVATEEDDGSVSVDEVDEDEKLPEDTKERFVETPKVCKYLTNGVEILEQQEWPGTAIPLVCCFGKILYVDEGGGPKRKILSLVRLARDPYMLYCYYRTCEAELVGMTPKFPYFVRRGSLLPVEFNNLQRSLSEPIAAIQVEAVSAQNPSGAPPEFPQRQPYEPPIQQLEMGAESARRAIQAAMGSMPLPTQAQGQNEKSGVALDKITDTTQQGTYHFVDHYNQAITRTGVLVEELIPHFYDTPRTVAVRKANGDVLQHRINDVGTPDSPPLPVDEADHDVTLSTGPSYASQRVASDEFMDSLVKQLPQLAQIFGPQVSAKLFALAIKARDLGPMGDEISELMSPPAPGGMPPQLAQQLQQLQQENQQLKQAIATGTAKITAKAQADIQVAQAEKQLASQPDFADLTKLKIADMTSARSAQAGVAEAEIKAGNADADRRVEILEIMLNVAKEERLAKQKADADLAQTRSDQTHEMLTKAHDHAHDHAMADHQHILDVAKLGAAAALAPEPQADETNQPQLAPSQPGS